MTAGPSIQYQTRTGVQFHAEPSAPGVGYLSEFKECCLHHRLGFLSAGIDLALLIFRSDLRKRVHDLRPCRRGEVQRIYGLSLRLIVETALTGAIL